MPRYCSQRKCSGTIVGAYEITSVLSVTDEQEVIDLNHLRKFRLKDGSVHIEDCYTQQLFDRRIFAVQSLPMIIIRTVLGKYELGIDC